MLQTGTEGVQGLTRLGGQGDPLGYVQEIQFDHANKWYMHNPAPVLETNTNKLLWDFDIQTDHLISVRKSRPYNNQPPPKKEENLQNYGLCCPG